MQKFLSDIKEIDWIWSVLPSDLKTLDPYKCFVFYYNNYEADSSIEIKFHHIIDRIENGNVFRFQSQKRTQNFGFFKDPLHTDNALLYLFLKFYLQKDQPTQEAKEKAKEKLDKLFLSWKAEDLQKIRNEGISDKKGIFEINSSTELENAVHRFVMLPQMRNGVITAFELVNSYFSSKYNHQLYGKKLKKIIQLINSPSGGIINEVGGSIRYMLVGENSAKAVSDGLLDKAKEMLRHGTDMKLIRIETGWYQNPFDGKWRKRISDKEMKLDFNKYTLFQDVDFGNVQVYAPLSEGISKEQIWGAVRDTRNSSIGVTNLLKNGYKGTIGNVVTHPLLFEYYPEIKNIPYFSAFYKPPLKKNGYAYYFSDKPKHLTMFGSLENNAKYIMLHEMQHYIQSKEGFANGGNLYVSELLTAVGGQEMRKFMSMFHQSIKSFCTDAMSMDLKRLVDYFEKQPSSDKSIRTIKDIFKDVESIKKNCEISFQIYANYYALNWQTNPMLRKLTKEVFGENYLNFFVSIVEGNTKKNEERINKLKGGWSADEIHTLFFNTYQSLAGEFESREVQHTAEIQEDLLDYFKFYSSESLSTSDVSVIFKEGIIEDIVDHVGALETTNEDTYIIHVKPSTDGENLLHELGHILEDEASKEPYYDIITRAYATVGRSKFDSISEFFVECYLGWIVRRNLNEVLCKSLEPKRVFPSLIETDAVFNYMFGYETERMNLDKLEGCYKFVNKLLNIV